MLHQHWQFQTLPRVEPVALRQNGLIAYLLREVFMSRGGCLPIVNGKLRHIPGQLPDPLAQNGAYPQARQLAHEVKNYMSVLLLGLANLDRDGEHWKISAREREVFEDAVLEINRLVEAVVELTKDKTPTIEMQGRHGLRPPQDAPIEFSPAENGPLPREV